MKSSKRWALVWSVAFLLITVGCDDESNGHGSAVIGVRSDALSLEDIDRVTVTVSGPHIAPEIVATLTGDSTSGWSGIIENIPAGDERTFLAQAYDASYTLLYSGQADDVTIIDETMIQVIIYLQQVDPPEPFENAVPRFESVVVSSNQVAPDDDVDITATASDPNGDSLVYAWSSTCGDFSDNASSSTTWTAPSIEDLCTLTVSATDPNDASATISFDIDVKIHNDKGSAEVLIDINTWPMVQGLVPDPSRIDVGESTQLDLAATDPDGDTLSFAWSADCTGNFSDNAVEDPTFTLGAENGGDDCTLSCTITDDRGGSNTASIDIATGPPIKVQGFEQVMVDSTASVDIDGTLYTFQAEALFNRQGDSSFVVGGNWSHVPIEDWVDFPWINICVMDKGSIGVDPIEKVLRNVGDSADFRVSSASLGYVDHHIEVSQVTTDTIHYVQSSNGVETFVPFNVQTPAVHYYDFTWTSDGTVSGNTSIVLLTSDGTEESLDFEVIGTYSASDPPLALPLHVTGSIVYTDIEIGEGTGSWSATKFRVDRSVSLPCGPSDCLQTTPCMPGEFDWVSVCDSMDLCVDGSTPLDGYCQAPQDEDGRFNCINSSDNCSLFTPHGVDCTIFNRELRTEDGEICLDANGFPRCDTNSCMLEVIESPFAGEVVIGSTTHTLAGFTTEVRNWNGESAKIAFGGAAVFEPDSPSDPLIWIGIPIEYHLTGEVLLPEIYAAGAAQITTDIIFDNLGALHDESEIFSNIRGNSHSHELWVELNPDAVIDLSTDDPLMKIVDIDWLMDGVSCTGIGIGSVILQGWDLSGNPLTLTGAINSSITQQSCDGDYHRRQIGRFIVDPADVSFDTGSYSGTGDITVVDYSKPAEVANLSATPGDTRVVLTWIDPPDSDFDHVRISWSPADGMSQPVTVNAGVEIATITGLTNGTEYTFTVQSVDGDNNTSTGVTDTATPAEVLPPGQMCEYLAVDTSDEDNAIVEGDEITLTVQCVVDSETIGDVTDEVTFTLSPETGVASVAGATLTGTGTGTVVVTASFLNPDATTAEGSVIVVVDNNGKEDSIAYMIIDPPGWRVPEGVTQTVTLQGCTEQHVCRAIEAADNLRWYVEDLNGNNVENISFTATGSYATYDALGIESTYGLPGGDYVVVTARVGSVSVSANVVVWDNEITNVGVTCDYTTCIPAEAGGIRFPLHCDSTVTTSDGNSYSGDGDAYNDVMTPGQIYWIETNPTGLNVIDGSVDDEGDGYFSDAGVATLEVCYWIPSSGNISAIAGVPAESDTDFLKEVVCSDAVSLSVNELTLINIDLNPDTLTVIAGARVVYTAEATYASSIDGCASVVRDVSDVAIWDVDPSDAALATSLGNGIFLAIAPGTVTIKADVSGSMATEQFIIQE
jgi:hypothetical protein